MAQRALREKLVGGGGAEGGSEGGRGAEGRRTGGEGEPEEEEQEERAVQAERGYRMWVQNVGYRMWGAEFL